MRSTGNVDIGSTATTADFYIADAANNRQYSIWQYCQCWPVLAALPINEFLRAQCFYRQYWALLAPPQFTGTVDSTGHVLVFREHWFASRGAIPEVPEVLLRDVTHLQKHS
jgi:hypothetical protein